MKRSTMLGDPNPAAAFRSSEHLILANPRSGRGSGMRVGEELLARLQREGFDAKLVPSLSDEGNLSPPNSEAPGALFVVGGDGTVHHALELARTTGRAIYHVPTGTENLFAREFQMARDLNLAARALRAGRTRTIDLGIREAASSSAPGLFALMCSVGPDARVIRRLSATRTGPIRHHSYLRPIAEELWRFSPSPISVFADGEPVLEHEPALVVIANSRQYALRINPARNADIGDGRLDLVVLPARSRTQLLTGLLAARLGRATPRAGVLARRARAVRVTSPDPNEAYQIDGEPGHAPPAISGSFELQLRVLPAAARVLLPPLPFE